MWQDYTKLPKPDKFGNYWFGKPGSSESVAILPIRSQPKLQGKYFVSLGSAGLMFNHGDFVTFDSPQDALRMIQTCGQPARSGA